VKRASRCDGVNRRQIRSPTGAAVVTGLVTSVPKGRPGTPLCGEAGPLPRKGNNGWEQTGRIAQ